MATTIDRKPIFDAVKALRGGQGFSPSDIAALDAAIDKALGISASPKGLGNAAAFYLSVRGVFGALTQAQVAGFEALLQAIGIARWGIAWTAYGLATSWHETNTTMEPVREAYWLNEQWRKEHLRYYPWYGRGFVQLTWKQNYQRADDELQLGGSLIANPDRALEPDIAAKILVHGMEAGWFTNHRLADYLPLAGNGTLDAYTGARYIINGQDKAQTIAKYALAFEDALSLGGWA